MVYDSHGEVESGRCVNYFLNKSLFCLSCLKTGGLFECGGGWAAELRRERAFGGLFMGPNAPASIENVAGAFGKITSFDNVTYPQTNTDSTMEMIEQCSRVDAGEGPDLD